VLTSKFIIIDVLMSVSAALQELPSPAEKANSVEIN